jgi:hypothetical protein
LKDGTHRPFPQADPQKAIDPFGPAEGVYCVSIENPGRVYSTASWSLVQDMIHQRKLLKFCASCKQVAA